MKHLPAYEDGTDSVFRNVGIENSDAGELPRRKRTPRAYMVSIILILNNYFTKEHQPCGVCKDGAVFSVRQVLI
jgi:hypothetical protein